MRLLERLLSLPVQLQQQHLSFVANPMLISQGLDFHSRVEGGVADYTSVARVSEWTTTTTTSNLSSLSPSSPHLNLDQLYTIMLNTPPEPLTGKKKERGGGKKEGRFC